MKRKKHAYIKIFAIMKVYMYIFPIYFVIFQRETIKIWWKYVFKSIFNMYRI